MELRDLTNASSKALKELLEVAELKPGQILVVGCSSSEVQGKKIGKSSSLEVGEAIFNGIYPLIKENGLFLAVQCCEHLNRSLIVETECAEKYGLELVTVIPYLKAGGGFGTTAFNRFENPVMVESIKAHAAMDIGDTLIGMHLKRVAVPIRGSIKSIGEAHLTMARTRPPLIGGERAKYTRD